MPGFAWESAININDYELMSEINQEVIPSKCFANFLSHSPLCPSIGEGEIEALLSKDTNFDKESFLDNNATYPTSPEVIKEITDRMAEVGNGSSKHRAGRVSRAHMEVARGIIHDYFNNEFNIIFTSGGTEANNMFLKSFDAGPKTTFLISSIEHDSLRNQKSYLEKKGFNVVIIPTIGGIVDLEFIKNNLFRDVVGLLITTKEPKGYTQEVVINGRKAYVCCDSEYRFVADVTKVNNKRIQLTTKEKQNVVRCYKKFQKENMRQMKARLK